jgi:hypothetical protein
MPGFPLPGRLGRELDEPLLDALLDGQLPPDAPEELRTVAEMLAGLAGPAEPGELAGEGKLVGEAAAQSAFTRRASPAGVSPAARPARRKTSWRAVAPRARAAAVLAAAAIGLGSTTAAAYAGMLPSPIQNIAHHMIGAPPAHRTGHPKPGKTPLATPQPAQSATAKPATSAKSQATQPTRSAKPAKPASLSRRLSPRNRQACQDG